MEILAVKNLSTHFTTDEGVIKAVDNVSLSIDKGEVVAIVGGSGSGKTILALSILRLVPETGKIVGGEIVYNGQDLLKISEEKLRQIRGRGISMIFQEPMTALNPVFTIENQIAEAINVHVSCHCEEPASSGRRSNPPNKNSQRRLLGEARNDNTKERVIELLNLVGIPDAKQKMRCYPFELSGGQRQRVMIAIALACKPDILIADEPTTALDVTIQAQILELLKNLQEKFGMAIILITHDFGIVAQTADRVYVMHNGKIVESGGVVNIFDHPQDEYTKKLLAAVPVI